MPLLTDGSHSRFIGGRRGGTANGLKNALIAMWPFDEAAGANDAADAHTNALTLTQYNSPGAAAGAVYATARTLDGVNQYFARASESLLQVGATDWTISAWIYLSSAAANIGIAGKWKSSVTNSYEWILFYNKTSNRFELYVDDNGASGGFVNVTASTFGNVPTEQWLHVLAWRDATLKTINISVNNGAFDSATYNPANIYAGSAEFRIGWADAASSERLTGRIGPVAIWRSAAKGGGVLYTAERTALYNAGAGVKYTAFTTEQAKVERYVMSAFPHVGHATNQKLTILHSPDATVWKEYSVAYATATTVGDFSIIKSGGVWRIVCSNTRTWLANVTSIGYWTSTDLVNWTIASIDLSGTTGAYHTTAPEWFVDSDGVEHIIYHNANAAGTDIKFWEIHPTTPGVYTAWSTPEQLTGAGIPAAVIDAYIVKIGATYYLWYKNESTKYIEVASASALTGPYTALHTGNWAGWGSGIEGPSLQKLGNTWRIWVDRYNAGTGTAYSDSTDDWQTWSALATVDAPYLLRHPTVMDTLA